MTWQRLSVELPQRERLNQCRACGATPGKHDCQVWQECDSEDRPEVRYVVLCTACADRLIEKHPRLYRQILMNEPTPGVMAICQDCIHRKGTTCTAAKAHGGPGVKFPAPNSSGFIDGTDKRGRRCGRSFQAWDKPMGESDCSGRQTAAPLTES